MDGTKRIIFVELFFYPEVASTGQYFTDLAVHFASRGCTVDVYTNRSEYLKEHHKLPRFEIYRGVRIHRLPCLGFSKDRKKGRIAEAALFFLLAGLALSFRRKGGVLFLGTNPPFLPLLGPVLKALRRWPYLVLLYDIHPQMSARLGWMSERSLPYRIWNRFNRWAYRRAGALVPIGRCMERLVRESYLDGAEGGRSRPGPVVKIIHNWEDGSRIEPIPKEKNPFAVENGLDGKFVVLYSGSIGLHHELDCLIEAASRLEDEPDILFLFIGEGAKKASLQETVRDRGLGNCLFLPYQPLESLRFSLTCGNLYVVTQERGLEGLIVSCKIYSALASGTPVLAFVHPETEVAAIVRESGAGVLLDPEDPEGIARFVREAARDRAGMAAMGRAARAYFEEHFEKKIAMASYEELFERVFGFSFPSFPDSAARPREESKALPAGGSKR